MMKYAKIDELIDLVPQHMLKYLVAVNFCSDCRWFATSSQTSVEEVRRAYDRGEVELATGALFRANDGETKRMGFALYSIPRKRVAVRYSSERFNRL